MTDSTPDSTIEPRLIARFEADPDQSQSVEVWFTELPPEPELAELGLFGAGLNPALGTLTAGAVARLASRPDVQKVTLSQEFYPS